MCLWVRPRASREWRQERSKGTHGDRAEGWQLRGQPLRMSPGAVPLPPSSWHMTEHLSNQASLGTGISQVFSRASGSCSLSNSYTCSSWTRLSSSPNSPQEKGGEKEKRKGQRAPGGGRLGDALWQDGAQQRVAAMGCHEWQDWAGGGRR